MAIYPQLISGAITQFPIVTRVEARTVTNNLADGSAIKLADTNGGATTWQLQYAGVTDDEAAAIEAFFETCEGSLNAFTFVDPAGNLLAWSEDLTNSAWRPDPLLAVTGGAADPMGGTAAFHLVNSGNAGQGISQTLNAPAAYTYTFSVYAQASQQTAFTMAIGAHARTFTAIAAWNRFVLTATGDPGASSMSFSIQCEPGALTIFGPQVDAQPSASAYGVGVAGGVYANARFVDDTLLRTSTAPNQNSLTVKITYVDHL